MKISKIFALVVSVFLVLAGCSGGKSTNSDANTNGDGKVKISFINGFTGGDGVYMKKITDAFNASQDKYVVTELQEKDHYTKFKSGDYDLVVIHGNNLKTYKQDGLIQDIKPVLDKAGIKETDFHKAGMDIVKIDGEITAVPLDIHPLTMFYNKELVKEAPKTYEDLLKINKTLQAENKDLYALGVPASGLVEFYMHMIAVQNGIELKDGNHLNFAQSKYADALMKFHDMVWQDKVSPPGLGLDGEFQTFMKEAKGGKAYQTAVALTGPWFYGAAKEKYGENLGVAPIPQIGTKLAAYGNAHTIALSSKVKDKKVLNGISEYLKFMFTPENLIHWAEGGQAPVHLATLEKIKAEPDKYQIAYQNSQQFDHYVSPPAVYQFGEQMRYMNETVFSKLVKTKDFTNEDLMKELKKATKMAKQIADTAPQK
ncbi:ABC transporter substrate-binding protein [Gottfriedia acidiceleris]|uniref:Extracellular solute-binding protein n=1 Tax=Gottfriedia acidiceleris TaxID=371036 RepID=A0ABY4JRW6_9BACI|nr:extracellular solute-binding protein [Gottfriedia acidiceleris]UPM55055.1 extracellular solute-binding protein [Gottfriedia acidiceleris]